MIEKNDECTIVSTNSLLVETNALDELDESGLIKTNCDNVVQEPIVHSYGELPASLFVGDKNEREKEALVRFNKQTCQLYILTQILYIWRKVEKLPLLGKLRIVKNQCIKAEDKIMKFQTKMWEDALLYINGLDDEYLAYIDAYLDSREDFNVHKEFHKSLRDTFVVKI